MGYREKYASQELNIWDLLGILWRNKVILSLFGLFFALVLFIQGTYFTNDTYTTSGVLYISNKNENAQENEINKNDIETSRSLTSTYIEILKTRDFLEDVSRDSVENKSWKEISDMITVHALSDTELIEISVTADSAACAYNIASDMIRKAPKKLMSVYKNGDIEVVNSVYYPTHSNDKQIPIKTLSGFIIGFLGGLLYIYAKNMLDLKITDAKELTEIYGISVLGEVSNLPDRHDRQTGDAFESILNENSNFTTIEEYKSIRTKIMFSIPKTGEGKAIVVTSSVPSEGKTTTSINTAITFAQLGAKVIIVDCDLRRSRVHRYLQLERGEGLSNVLCGFCKLEETIKTDVMENLDVLSSGEIPLDPVKLIESNEFDAVISELKKRYDYVFIDTPPVTVVTDAIVAMQRSDGVILVANKDVTTYDLIDEALKDIKNSKTKILGAIVLDSKEKQKMYKSYKNYKYSYKNGYKYTYCDDNETV